jgi:hypothetical protein
MPFTKFVSLLTYQSIWFAKLNILQDEYEGRIPSNAMCLMREEGERWKTVFASQEHRRQIDEWPVRNEADGRELLVTSCWFAGEAESPAMWSEYGGSTEAVAVKSTIGRLARHIYVPHEETVSQLGFVQYIDRANFEMGTYEASQAIERAFLKDRSKFGHENEVRIVTMNFKTTKCITPEGAPYLPEQIAGAKMNNFENPGLYVGTNLSGLIHEVVLAPGAHPWFERLVRRLVESQGITSKVVPSSIQNFG